MKQLSYTALVGITMLTSCSQNGETSKEQTQAFTVQTEKAMIYDGEIQLGYSGVVEAKKVTTLSFSTMGSVTEILVEEGQKVNKGQLLAKSNAANAQSAYQAAMASQQQAEDAYKRLKPMKENGTLPEIKWVEVETGLAQAQAAVAITQKTIQDCNLYAPENGVVGRKYIQSGMNVIPGNPVIELLNIQSVYIKIPVPEREVNLFKKGDTAQIYIAAIDKTVTGTIMEIGVSADVLSHTYPIRIEVINTDGIIKPGMVCAVKTTAKATSTGILLSNKALQKDASGQQFIYINKGGKAIKKNVQTLSLIDNKVLVQGDLKEEDQIVVSGQQKLVEGSPIHINN